MESKLNVKIDKFKELCKEKGIIDEYEYLGKNLVKFLAKSSFIKPEEYPTEVEIKVMKDVEWETFLKLHTLDDINFITREHITYKVPDYEPVKGEGFFTLAALLLLFGLKRKDFLREDKENIKD